MEIVKLSQLNPETPIAYGSRKILACAERLFLDIYEGKRKRKVIAIIGDKNYEVEYDVKREQVKEVVVCCNKNKEVDKNVSICPFGCDDYLVDKEFEGSCLEIRHLLIREVV